METGTGFWEQGDPDVCSVGGEQGERRNNGRSMSGHVGGQMVKGFTEEDGLEEHRGAFGEG